MNDTQSELEGQIRTFTEQCEFLLEAYQRAHEVNIAAVQEQFDMEFELANLNLQLTNEQHSVRALQHQHYALTWTYYCR